jgi:predicted DCC family thiol-disulfide oxidoreductase YuxK
MKVSEKHLVLYDGVCRFCNKSVQLLLKIDRQERLYFAPLQSELAKKLAKKHFFILQAYAPESIVLVKYYGSPSESISHRSSAISDILIIVGGWYKVLGYLLKLLPRFLRDGAYRFIARHRYRWFGKYEHCKIPSSEQRRRFLG